MYDTFYNVTVSKKAQLCFFQKESITMMKICTLNYARSAMSLQVLREHCAGNPKKGGSSRFRLLCNAEAW